jgi:hypothetical protein
MTPEACWIIQYTPNPTAQCGTIPYGWHHVSEESRQEIQISGAALVPLRYELSSFKLPMPFRGLLGQVRAGNGCC